MRQRVHGNHSSRIQMRDCIGNKCRLWLIIRQQRPSKTIAQDNDGNQAAKDVQHSLWQHHIWCQTNVIAAFSLPFIFDSGATCTPVINWQRGSGIVRHEKPMKAAATLRKNGKARPATTKAKGEFPDSPPISTTL